MGDNLSYALMEETLHAMWRTNHFDKKLIDHILNIYGATDADEGGYSYGRHFGGKDMWEAVVNVVMPDFIPRPYTKEEEKVYWGEGEYDYYHAFEEYWKKLEHKGYRWVDPSNHTGKGSKP